MTAVRPAPRRSRVAAQAAVEQSGEVGVPLLLLGGAELVEVGPAEDAGVVLVVEADTDGVVADRLDLLDAHMAAAGDDLLLVRPVALHLGRRALDPQVLGRVAEGAAVIEIDFDLALVAEQAHFDRPRRAGAG